ncbi:MULTISPECIES: fimbrial protein [Providencia]|uniref:Type 1 fimbrial protein n=1 Tax=Providencia rettgeri TaxID=587 RepID=A0A3R8XDD6_PRORE|nr:MULTISPECIES: fimbrial protein [Providencia]ELR5075478.1 type 1 fimbrial protein [Providencia stuartii]ELR5069110.1 type 1 fimbrial protein [Providencia rettgeri]ELR5219393.1 type 1 fimbrial protein [Providencia rettgeri]ELR5221324.1 type 1 fimbrial protein [Providencia rettgeri]MBV2188194.1 type 1 fimbrial protein [Providencia rettgeri]
MVINKRIVATALTVAGLCLSTTLSYAADVTINIYGQVKTVPCTVVTANKNVDLNDLSTFDFINAGSTSKWHPIELELINCPTGSSNVTARFTGVSDITGYYRNQGTAQNIQLQLQDDSGRDLNNGTQAVMQINSSTASANFPLKVRAISVNGGTTQGSIQAAIDVTYTYQ